MNEHQNRKRLKRLAVTEILLFTLIFLSLLILLYVRVYH